MYTPQEYAEKAVEANATGRLLIVNESNELEIITPIETNLNVQKSYEEIDIEIEML